MLHAVLGYWDYEGECLLGVFTTREGAMVCRNKHLTDKDNSFDEVRIRDIRPDDPDFDWLNNEYW